MTREIPPEDVRRFILNCISSVPHLEALLIVRAENTAWNAQQLASRLYIGEKQAGAILADLAAQGFLHPDETVPPSYIFRPAMAEITTVIEHTADYYARHIVEVSQLIHSNIKRQAQHFADAFKFRKDS